MSCQEIQERFPEFFDNLTLGRENKELIDHLKKCEKCRGEWERFRCICDCLKHIPNQSPPNDVVKEVMSRIEAIHGEKRWRGHLKTWQFKPVYALAFACVFLFIIYFWSEQGSFLFHRKPNHYLNTFLMGKTGTVRPVSTDFSRIQGNLGSSVSMKRPKYKTIAIYVDNINQAEKRIDILASHVSPGNAYDEVKEHPVHKVLSQFKLNVPVYRYNFMVRELSKIGYIPSRILRSRNVKGESGSLGDMGHWSGFHDHKLIGKTERFQMSKKIKPKMGQGYNRNFPVVPVALVIISRSSQ